MCGVSRVCIHASRRLTNFVRVNLSFFFSSEQFLVLISLLFCFTWRLREGRVRVIVFSFRILLHTSLLQDVPAYPVTASFIVGVRLQRNAEQARKHRHADSLIRTRQLHVVSCINQDM